MYARNERYRLVSTRIVAERASLHPDSLHRSHKTEVLAWLLICMFSLAGCGEADRAEADPTPSPLPPIEVEISSTTPPTQTPTGVPSPTITPTAMLASLDLVPLVVTLEDLPGGFIVLEPGELFFGPGEVIPMIDLEVERAFSYIDPARGQAISGALFVADQQLPRARLDAMMPFAIQAYLSGFNPEHIWPDDQPELGLGQQDPGEVAYFGGLTLDNSETLRRAEAIMFRRGIVGAFIQSLSAAEAPEVSIEAMASILDTRIRELVPEEGWLGEQPEVAGEIRIELQAVTGDQSACGYRFGSEGFAQEEPLIFRLLRPDGAVHVGTESLALPVTGDDLFSFNLSSEDPQGLWIVEFEGVEHSAAYVFRWTGECDGS